MKQAKPIKLTKLLKKSPGKEARIIGKKIRKPKDQYAFLHIPTGKYFCYNDRNMVPEQSKQILTASSKDSLIYKLFNSRIGNFSKIYSVDDLAAQEVITSFLNPITKNEHSVSIKIPKFICINIYDFYSDHYSNYSPKKVINSFTMTVFLIHNSIELDETNNIVLDSQEIEFENLEANLIEIFKTLQTEGYFIDEKIYQFSSNKTVSERITLSEFEIVLYKEAK